jgi:hypothetical protein
VQSYPTGNLYPKKFSDNSVKALSYRKHSEWIFLIMFRSDHVQ